MIKLLMLKGLPASGKTTQARKLVGQGWVRVSKGDIHSMLYQDIHTNDTEKQVSTIYNDIIDTSLERGRNVVVDDTNLDPASKRRCVLWPPGIRPSLKLTNAF